MISQQEFSAFVDLLGQFSIAQVTSTRNGCIQVSVTMSESDGLNDETYFTFSKMRDEDGVAIYKPLKVRHCCHE